MTFTRMPRFGNFCVRVISIFLIPTFILSNIAYAAPTTDSVKNQSQNLTVTNPESIVVPREFGLIKTKFTGKDDRLVIHIQDAHCNYEAQSNIVKILETLHKNYNVSLVSVEGADGVIDTSWFKAFPDDEVRKEVADYFMKKGEITGPEFLSITTDYNIKLFGAETRSYYIDNLNAFTSSYPLKDQTEKYLNSIRSALNRLKTLIYSEDLRLMDAKYQDYDSKKLQFNDYVKFLQVEAEKAKINLRTYENFFKLVSVLVYEKKIDFTVTDKERSALIDSLSKDIPKDKLTELVNKSLEFKTGKISSADYYAYLKKLATDNGADLAKDYPNLYNYIIYNSVYSKIENEKLFNDIKKLEGDIKEKLFTTDDQRTLEKLSRHIEILIGLVNIKLLNGDYEYFEANKTEFSHESFSDFIKKKTIQYGLAYEMDDPNDAVAKALPKLEDFYSIAVKRDKALVDNTLGQMGKDKTKVAVLVTGGFHSEGMSKLLEKQGVSYMVICPSITKDLPTPYIQILTNQKTPLSDILVTPVHASEGVAIEDSGALAPALRTELATLSEADLESFLSAVRGGTELRAAVERFKDEWYRISVNGVRIGDVKIVEGYVNHMRSGVGGVSGSATIIVDNMMKGLKANLDELEVPQADRAKIRVAVQQAISQIPDLRDRMVAEVSRVQAQKGRASPGKKAVASNITPIVLGANELSDAQDAAFNEILRQSFVEGTYRIVKARDLGILNLRGFLNDFQFCVHYGLEARIDKYNREHPGVNLANDRVCAGRGGAEFQHNLHQAHISDYRFSYLMERGEPGKQVLYTIAIHEEAHIAIANGELVNNRRVSEEDFVDNYVPGANTRAALSDFEGRTIREVLASIDRDRATDEAYMMEEALLTDTSYGTTAQDEIVRLRKEGKYSEATSFIKEVYTRLHNIDLANTSLIQKDYKGYDIIIVSCTTPEEAAYQQKVLEEAFNGVKTTNGNMKNKVCVLAVVDMSEGGQIIGQVVTMLQARGPFKNWAEANGLTDTDIDSYLKNNKARMAIYHNGGKGERFSPGSQGYGNSRGAQPYSNPIQAGEGRMVEDANLILGVVRSTNALAMSMPKDDYRVDTYWANQTAYGTVDATKAQRSNYLFDKFVVKVPKNPKMKDLFDYGTAVISNTGKIIKFLANKVLTKKDSKTGTYVENPDYKRERDELLASAKGSFDYGSFSMSKALHFAMMNYWVDVKHIDTVMGPKLDRKVGMARDIDPAFVQIIVPLTNGLTGKILPALPSVAELDTASDKTALLDQAYNALAAVMESEFRAAIDKVYKKSKDPVLETIEMFIRYRDLFTDLDKVVGSIDLGENSYWFAFKRILDMSNNRLLMLSDIIDKNIELEPSGEVASSQVSIEDKLRAEAARRVFGIKNDAVAVFEVNGKTIKLTAKQMKDGWSGEGIEIKGSIIQGKCILLPGSKIANSFVNNSSGRIVSENSYIETSVAPAITAKNSILIKVIDLKSVSADKEIVADAYRPSIKDARFPDGQTRMRAPLGYDPKPADKELAAKMSDAVKFGDNAYAFQDIREMACNKADNDKIENNIMVQVMLKLGMTDALARQLVKMDAAGELTDDFMKFILPLVRQYTKTPSVFERRATVNKMIANGVAPAAKLTPRVYTILFNVSAHISRHETFMLKKYPGVLPKAGQSPETGMVRLDIGIITRNEAYEHNLENFPMGPFGTSGIRAVIEFLHSISNDAIAQGLVSFFTETDGSKEHDPIGLAGDLRPNTGEPFRSNGAMLEAIAIGLIKSHRTIYNGGRAPTGAITLAGIPKHIQTIMNTASHNPFDESMGYYNGFKPTRADGEVLKGDERRILAHVREMMEIEYRLSQEDSMYGKDGEYKKEGLTTAQQRLIERARANLTAAVQEVNDIYRTRYLEAFGPTALSGAVTGFWKHTAVGRELIPGIIKGIGGHVYSIGLRKNWDMVVDTEDIKPKTAQEAQRLAKWLKESLDKLSGDISGMDTAGMTSVSFVDAARAKLAADSDLLDLFNQILGYLPHDISSYTAVGARQALSEIAKNDSKNFQGLDTTDGDSDRPGLFDENGIFNYGDKLDYLACEYIREDCDPSRPMHVVVTATVNEKVIKRLESLGMKVHKVQIGSPYVVKKIQEITAADPSAIVVGFERNGGFLIGTELAFENNRKIAPLPTRDSTFPLICAHILATREGKTISSLIKERFSGEFSSFSWSGLVDNDTKDTPFAREWCGKYTAPMGQAIMRDFAPPLDTAPDKRITEVTFGADMRYDTFDGETGNAKDRIINGRNLSNIMQEIRERLKGYFPDSLIPGEIVKLNYLDGVRVYFSNGEIVHMRPSGNAPQWRIYAEAAAQDRSKAIIEMRLVAYPNIIKDFVSKAEDMRKATRFVPKSIEDIKKTLGLSKIVNEVKTWEMTFGDKGQHREDETMIFTHDSLTLRSHRAYDIHDASKRKDIERKIVYYPGTDKDKRRVQIIETVNGTVTVNVSVTGENAFIDIGKTIDRNVPIMIWKAPFGKDASLGLVEVNQPFPVMSDDVMMELEWNGVSFLHLFNIMPSSIIAAEPLLWDNVFNFEKISAAPETKSTPTAAQKEISIAADKPGRMAIAPDAGNDDIFKVVPSSVNVEDSLNRLFNNQPVAMTELEILKMFDAEANDYIRSYLKLANKDDLKRYLRLVAEKALDLNDAEVARRLQTMAGVTLGIISLIEDSVAGADKLRLTINPADMLKAKDKDRGLSYIDAQSVVDSGIGIADAEGAMRGMYWRGVEGVTKLGVVLNNDSTRVAKVGPNISVDAMYDKEKFASQSPKMVMYVMLHVGGYHTTVFLHDYIPGTIQHTSTGVGHLQNDAMDIKYAVSGRGLQLNKTDANISAQRLESGRWAVAYPYNVDEIVNLGGLVFNDFSFKVPGVASQAATLTVPYCVVNVNGQEAFVANSANVPALNFNATTAPADNVSIRDLYVYGDQERYMNRPKEMGSTVEPVIVTPEQVARAAQATKIAEAAQPVISRPANVAVFKKYAWAGTGISRLLGIATEKIAEIWFNSTQKDGLSKIPGTEITLAEAIVANPDRMLGAGMTSKPVFNKILGKDENQPQIVHIGFNDKIKGSEARFISLITRERALVVQLKNSLSIKDEAEFNSYRAVYEAWVQRESAASWSIDEIPALTRYAIVDKDLRPLLSELRQVRQEIVSYLNEVKLDPGQVIISPVGYIHSIVGSHQTHPPSTHPEAKNEAWYIIADGNGGLLYFEPQQTSNTTYSPFDFPTPIAWDAKTSAPVMRKDLTKGLDALLKTGETAPTDEASALKLMSERALKFEATSPGDFIVNDRTMDVTPEYNNPVRTTVEKLIHGSYPVMENPPFNLERISLVGEGAGAPASIQSKPVQNSFHELTVVKGEVTAVINGKEEILPTGSTIFVPAASKAPIEIKSSGEAEVLKTYPSKPTAHKSALTGAEIAAIENKETGHIKYLTGTLASKEMKSLVKSLEVDDGVIINAFDTSIEETHGVVQAAQNLINQEAGNRVINIRGTGELLIQAIEKEIAAHQGRVKAVVTTTPDQKIAATATQYGSVINVERLKDSKGHYVPVPGLQDLALRIAVANVLYKDKTTSEYTKDGARFVFQALDRIALAPDNKPFTVSDVLDLLKKGFFRILPRIVPVDLAAAREAYIAAKAALQSL